VPVEKEIPITVDREDLLQAHRPRGRPASEHRKSLLASAAEEALKRLPDLISPALAYDVFPVERVTEEQVYLSRRTVLEIGPYAHLLEEADEVLIAACTIGEALDEAVQAYFRSGESLLGLMLDSAGVIALGESGAHVFRLAEERAAATGGGVSPCLSPGSLSGWSLAGQGELIALLPVEEIGISLNEAFLLIPYKSVSFLIGIGEGYREHAVGSLCSMCALSSHCWRRRD
jgi:hypothetical protein